ncbi:MAG: hypothetical protein AB7T49_18205 [Oligoflexales bacterium]
MSFKSILIFLALGATACDDSQERPEKVDRFRGIGSVTNPLGATPSQEDQTSQVEVSVYFVMPTDDEIQSVDPYEDEGSAAVPALGEASIVVDQSSITHEDYGDVRLGSFKATLTVPPVEELPSLLELPWAQVRYGFVVKSSVDTETIVGNFVVALPGSDALAWTNPTIEIEAPVADESVGLTTTQLQAKVDDVNDEPLKIGWFVSSGEVTNRRSLATTWKKYKPTAQTIVATVHGKWSRGFNYKIINVAPE